MTWWDSTPTMPMPICSSPFAKITLSSELLVGSGGCVEKIVTPKVSWKEILRT